MKPTTKNPTTKTATPSPGEALRHVEKRIEHTAMTRLGEMTKRFGAESQSSFLLEALRLAEPMFLRESKAKDLFNSVEAAWNFEDRGEWREAIGFDETGALVWTDGKRLRPIGVKASLRWVVKMQQRYHDADSVEQGCDGGNAQLRWFKLLAKELK